MRFPWRESALNLRSHPRGLFYFFFFFTKTMTQCHSQIANLHFGTTLTEIKTFLPTIQSQRRTETQTFWSFSKSQISIYSNTSLPCQKSKPFNKKKKNGCSKIRMACASNAKERLCWLHFISSQAQKLQRLSLLDEMFRIETDLTVISSSVVMQRIHTALTFILHYLLCSWETNSRYCCWLRAETSINTYNGVP